jgi:hypothetical protein
MKEIILRLQIPKDVTYDSILSSRIAAGKFIVYEYLIPRPFFPPVKRISRIYFLKPNEKPSKYSLRYNLINLFWGWWGLPFGPVHTYNAVRKNINGVDFTEDVFDNLTKEDFEKRIVKLKKINLIFIHPDKSSLKEMVKSFKSFSKRNYRFESNPFVGEFIDTENPYYIIGLSDKDYEKREEIKRALYKYFYAHTRFEFMRISDSSEIINKLFTQGIEINCN